MTMDGDTLEIRAPRAALAIFLAGLVGVLLVMLSFCLLHLWQIPLAVCLVTLVGLLTALCRWQRLGAHQHKLPIYNTENEVARHPFVSVDLNNEPTTLHHAPTHVVASTENAADGMHG